MASVNISIEAPVENQIQEITYNGQEIYQPPLTMSENLARLATKIDFSKTNFDEIRKEMECGESADDEAAKDAGQGSLWPWDSVLTKLKSAFTEISVLADVLSIAKDKRYMVLDHVPAEPPETKPMAQVYARKKALTGAATVLLSGVERLRNSQNEQNRNRMTPDFHIELLRLRQNWRLKKVGNTIIGDLSYRTAGSKYPQAGVFEVTKAEDEEPPLKTEVPQSPAQPAKQSSALRIVIPSELHGIAYIGVLRQKVTEDLCASTAGLLPSGSMSQNNNPDKHWQQRLEAAQNVLFCNELFNLLAREAVQLHAPIPHMVLSNQMMASMLPGMQLIISLCHTSGMSIKSTQKSEHDHVLEHSLHQLLRQVHHKNTHHPLPHPSSAPLGPSKRRALAGPTAVDRHSLLEMTQTNTLLEQIIAQAQHFFLRMRTEYVLDTIIQEVKDPLIVSHWNSLNSPTLSCVKINIITHGYDTICRTSMIIQVMEKSLKAICRDGRVMHMSYESQELRDLIYCQIYQHQMQAISGLAKCMGWQYLASSPHLGVGPVEPLGNAASCILSSPIGDRLIAVRCEPQGGVQVSIAHSPKKDFYSGQLVKEQKWENLGGSFKEVLWDKMEGKNFLNKMELLMASLTSS